MPEKDKNTSEESGNLEEEGVISEDSEKHETEQVVLAYEEDFFSDVREEVIKRGLDSRDWLTKASIAIMVISNLLTFLIILLHGFKYQDFSLPEAFLHWLGGATIGTLIANTTVLYKHLYRESIFITGGDKK